MVRKMELFDAIVRRWKLFVDIGLLVPFSKMEWSGGRKYLY
jgi:hypothetical protein